MSLKNIVKYHCDGCGMEKEGEAEWNYPPVGWIEIRGQIRLFHMANSITEGAFHIHSYQCFPHLLEFIKTGESK